MPVETLNLCPVPEECEYNCGPATAQMITKGGFIQSKVCHESECWYTHPLLLAAQINSGGAPGYAPLAFKELPEGAAALAATSIILQSIMAGSAAAAAIHWAHHWVACDAFAFRPMESDGVYYITGISFLDPEVTGPKEIRPFGIVFEQRRFVWMEPWLSGDLTVRDSNYCTEENGRIYIVAGCVGSLLSVWPVRTRPLEGGANLDEAAITSRIASAMAPHWEDLSKILGLVSPCGCPPKSVTMADSGSGPPAWARIHFATGDADRELVVIVSTMRPVNDNDGLCLIVAGILLPSSGDIPPLPGAGDFRSLLELRTEAKSKLTREARDRWLKLLADPALHHEISELYPRSQPRDPLQPYYRLKVGDQQLFITPDGALLESLDSLIPQITGA